jgi:small subunit ribosomal protein S18
MATQKSNKKKKVCPIDEMGLTHIDYKDTVLLKKFLTKFNRIVPRYYSGTSLKNQKKIAAAIKRARYMALLPYVLDVKFQPETPKAHVAPVVASEFDESAATV